MRWCGLLVLAAVASTAVGVQRTVGAQGSQVELIVRNAVIVNAEGRLQGDIRIRDEKIVEIGANLAALTGARELDAGGLLVLPGGVDPHVHATSSLETLETASAAALAGGITTISTFVGAQAEDELATAVRRMAERVKIEAMADFMIHANINDPERQLGQLTALAETGQTSIKIFLNNRRFDERAGAFLDVIARAGELGLMPLLHCEDEVLIQYIGQRYIDQGKGDLRYYAEARPVVTEEAATQRCVAFSEATGAPVYIVHMSSERALRVAELGRARGLPVFTEVRHLYLNLTDDIYEREDRGIFIGRPPMRKQSDVDYLWQGIAGGTVDVVDTDHVPYTREEKLAPQTVLEHRAGMSSLQEIRSVIWSEGVSEKRITPEQFVRVTATNPAKLMGLYPRKGTIAVGSDADLVLWDPGETRIVRDEDMLSAAKFSIYAGRSFTGWPQVTIRRGEVVWQDGRITSRPGSGQLIPRQRWQKPLS